MLVNLPPAIMHMSGQLIEFVELMAAKLMVNSHKDSIKDKDIPVLLRRMADEVQEFRDQIKRDINDPNSLEELGDVANFAFLLYQYLRQRGVKNATERFIDEFYEIDVEFGRVYCKKTRSGSPLKPGDEVKGSMRGGRVYIRAQHAITGASLSVARADLVWWASRGSWPPSKVLHTDDGTGPLFTREQETVDAHWNLTLQKPTLKSLYPFISQYKPKGRERSVNYGKWVYQRRHAFKLVRCGYYDTPEKAATQGLKDWKEKTRA